MKEFYPCERTECAFYRKIIIEPDKITFHKTESESSIYRLTAYKTFACIFCLHRKSSDLFIKED